MYVWLFSYSQVYLECCAIYGFISWNSREANQQTLFNTNQAILLGRIQDITKMVSAWLGGFNWWALWGVWFLVLWHHQQKLGGIRWYCGFSLSRTSFSKGKFIFISCSSSFRLVSFRKDEHPWWFQRLHEESSRYSGNVLDRFGIQKPWDHPPWFPEDTRFGNQYPKTVGPFSNKQRNHWEKVSSKPKEPNDCWGLTIYVSGRPAYLERNRHL